MDLSNGFKGQFWEDNGNVILGVLSLARHCFDARGEYRDRQ